MGYRIASIPHSRRPSLRPSSTRPGSSAGVASEALGLGIGLGGISQRASRALSRAPSLGPQYEETVEEAGELSTVIDQEVEVEEAETEIIETDSRSASNHKRRKRGRKGKGVQQASAASANDSSSIVDKTLNTLAEASQALARELSRTSRSVPASSQTSVTTPAASIHHSAATTINHIYSPLEHQTTSNVALQSPLVQVSSSSSRTSSLKAGVTSSTISAPSPLSTSVTPISSSITTLNPPPPTISKKPSKWRLGFGKGSHGQSDRSSVSSSKSPALQSQSSIDEVHSHSSLGSVSSKSMSTTASNVTNLLMGLNAPPQTPKNASTSHRGFIDGHSQHHAQDAYIPPSSSVTSLEEPSIWQRGRRPKVIGGARKLGAGSTSWGPSGATSAFGLTGSNNGPYGHGSPSNHSNTSWGPSNGSQTNLSVNPNFSLNNLSNQSFHNNNDRRSDRAVSPTSTRSGRQPVPGPSSSGGLGSREPNGTAALGAGSRTNNDWRASMSSLGGASTMSGSSAFTRLSNGSQRSVSTAATSVSSASSWRSNGSKYPYSYDTTGQLPPNVKRKWFHTWQLCACISNDMA